MIAFDTPTHRFMLRAAAIVRRDDAVLLCRLPRMQDYWFLPGGRIDPGECAAQTLVREMHEEAGEGLAVGELACVAENFFSEDGRAFHEVGLYHAARLLPGSRLLAGDGPHAGREGDEPIEFRWFARDALAAIDLRPAFLARWLAEPAPAIAHVVQRA